MLKTGAAAMVLAIGLFTAQSQGWAQASTGEAPAASQAPDPGPHPEFDADTDYAYWCNSTIRSLVMMDILQEKHFKRNPQDIIHSLDQRIGNVALNMKKAKIEQNLQDYDAYYLGDTVAFSTSKNPKDLRKDLRGCRVFF